LRYGTGFIVPLVLLFVAMLSAQGQVSTSDCLECHGDKELTKVVDDTIEVSLFVDLEKFGNSVHGGFECVDCHENIEEIPHDENQDLFIS